MKKLETWIDENRSLKKIKAVVGIRGIGKAKMLLRHLPEDTLYLNFDDPKYRRLKTADDVLEYLKPFRTKKVRAIVIREPWRIWRHEILMQMLQAQNCWNIFTVSSNGRIFHMTPGELKDKPIAIYHAWTPSGIKRSPQEMFNTLDSIFVRDIADGLNNADVRRIRAQAEFYSDNLGDVISDRQMAQMLVVDGEKRSAPLIGKFRKALELAYFVEFCECYDTFEKCVFKNHARVFFTDLGLRDFKFGPALTDEKRRVALNKLYLKLRYDYEQVYWLRGTENAPEFVTIEKDGSERIWKFKCN